MEEKVKLKETTREEGSLVSLLTFAKHKHSDPSQKHLLKAQAASNNC